MDCQSLPSSPLRLPTSSCSSIHLSYEYAQKLNNNAALCIECGQYQRAESTLTKALHLSKSHIEQRTMAVCTCYHCTLDGCIIFTEDSHRALHEQANGKDPLDRGVVVNDPVGSSSCSCVSPPDSYIYKRAIRVPCLNINDGHNMGPVLSLIIAFNLGLAMHLRAMKEGEEGTLNAITRRRVLLERSLRLYEVASKFMIQYFNGRDQSGKSKESGVQFKIVLYNNICNVYRHLNGNKDGISCTPAIHDPSIYAHNKYQEELLSAMMFVLERNVTRTSSENDSTSIHFLDQCPKTRFIDIEGFWKTVGHRVLRALCADVA